MAQVVETPRAKQGYMDLHNNQHGYKWIDKDVRSQCINIHGNDNNPGLFRFADSKAENNGFGNGLRHLSGKAPGAAL